MSREFVWAIPDDGVSTRSLLADVLFLPSVTGDPGDACRRMFHTHPGAELVILAYRSGIAVGARCGVLVLPCDGQGARVTRWDQRSS